MPKLTNSITMDANPEGKNQYSGAASGAKLKTGTAVKSSEKANASGNKDDHARAQAHHEVAAAHHRGAAAAARRADGVLSKGGQPIKGKTSAKAEEHEKMARGHEQQSMHHSLAVKRLS